MVDESLDEVEPDSPVDQFVAKNETKQADPVTRFDPETKASAATKTETQINTMTNKLGENFKDTIMRGERHQNDNQSIEVKR